METVETSDLKSSLMEIPVSTEPKQEVIPELTLSEKREKVNTYLEFNFREFNRLLPQLTKKPMMRVISALLKYPLEAIDHKQRDDLEARCMKHAFLVQDMKTLLSNFALQEEMEKQALQQEVQPSDLNGEIVESAQQLENTDGKTENSSRSSLQE